MKTTAMTLVLVLLAMVLGAVAQGDPPANTPPWTTDVDEDDDGAVLPSAGPGGRHFRVLMEVTPEGMQGVRDLPVQRVLNLVEILTEHTKYPSQTSEGRTFLQGFRLDPDSFILHEVDAAGANPVRVPVQVIPGSVLDSAEFHPERNPTVTLRWVLPGATDGTRYFVAYFDTVHNDRPPAPPMSAQAELPLATAIGPGRGTTLFAPLDPGGLQAGTGERRHVRVTALHDGTDVEFYEYSGMRPNNSPAQTETGLNQGDTRVYVFGGGSGGQTSGSIMVKSNLPVLAQALSMTTSQRSSVALNDFVPSVDGGFLGKSFLANPAAPETWHVHCPSAASEGGVCTGSFNRAGSTEVFTIGGNQTISLNIGTGGITRIMVDEGAALVQREGRGLSFWPAVDGPRTASQYLGFAGNSDQLLLTSMHDNTCIITRSRAENTFLTTRQNPLCLSQGAFHEHPSWGVSMDRRWEAPQSEHATGPLEMRTFPRFGSPSTGLGVVAGPLDSLGSFNSLVVPQSPDGGLTYRIYVPASSAGNTLGDIVLFALHGDTRGVAEHDDGTSIHIQRLRAGERFNLQADPGLWTITMDRPVVASWLTRMTLGPFGAYAPGSTDAATLEVTGADYAGAAVKVDVQGSPFTQRQPGDLAQFTLDVTNLARDVTGQELADTVNLHLVVPDNWGQSNVVPPTRHLGAGETGTFEVRASIPEAASGSGATLRVIATSDRNPNLGVEQVLQVSFVIRRGVEVTEVESVESLEVTKNIAHGETATYHVRVTNRGSAPDSFDMQFSQPPGRWDLNVIAADAENGNDDVNRTPELQPNEHADYFLEVTPSQEVSLATRLTTRISATSLADRSVMDTLRAVTIVGVERSFRVLVDEPTRTIEPGKETTFTLTIKNDAEVNEELLVGIHSALPDGWDDPEVVWVDEDTSLEAVNHTIRLDAHGNATLTLTRSVPEGAPALSLALDRVRMHSQFDRDAPASDTALRVLAATKRGIEASVEGPMHAIDPGAEARLFLELESKGNVNQTITVRPILPNGDWSVLGEDETPPPWQVHVPAFGSTRFPVHVNPDPSTPAGVDAARLDFELTGTGLSAQQTGFAFEIEQRRAVAAEGATIRLDPGRALEVPVVVRNTGNVDLQLNAEWDGLPDWHVETQPLAIAPGERGILRTWLRVPSTVTATDEFTATLDLTQDSNVLSTTEWTFTMNAPHLEAVIEEIRPISDNQAGYRVRVTNTGVDAAHNVSILLAHDTQGTIDSFLILQIRPGATATANLLGPADSSGLSVIVIADHDPNGLRITPTEIEVDDRFLPAPGLALILVTLTLILGLGSVARWRWKR